METPLERNILEVSKTITEVANNIDQNVWGYRSGLKALDDILLGFHDGELIIIAGRPSIGKSSLATSIAMGVSEEAKTLYLSLELSSKTIQERMICQEAEVNFYEIKKNGVGNNKAKILKAAKSFENRQLYIDDAPTLNPLEFQKIIEKEKIKCAIVDYIQLVSFGGWSENRVKEIDMICRDLRNTAKIYGIPVILLAQLNRQVEQRTDRTPRLCDLRDSGAIEQLSQVVLLIHRPNFYEQRELNMETEDTWDTEILIAKNYNGPTGKIHLGFIEHSMKFIDRSTFE